MDFYPQKSNIPKMVFTDEAIHSAQYLLHALHNPAPEIPLVTLRNSHTSDLRGLAGIFEKANPRALPQSVVPTEIKRQHQTVIEQNSSTTNILDHAKTSKVTIVEAYSEEIQQVKPFKKAHPEKFQQLHLV